MDPELSKSILEGGRRVYLVRVARAQRMLILIVGVTALLYGGSCFSFPLVFSPMGLRVDPWIAGTFWLISFALAVAAIVQTCRLAIATGGNPIIAAIVGLLMFLPFLGFIAILAANGRATRILQKQGARVGFLGVSREEMNKLIVGACKNCGYDIRGLTGAVCPECGRSLIPPVPPTVRRD